ncbi:thermonuclease family protein [Desulfobulbus elongatus]|uniref:thermonuclease family protein n=1 Tax=Desulfobulbus elongatus TaxID=53332 RepID=UPI0006867359|nr:thermonuclease family protein [Desulfobulbus elongatus]
MFGTKCIRYFVTTLILFASATAVAVPAKIIGIVDGDSLKATIEGKLVEIRLYGIDAPETDQPGGKQATRAVQRLIAGGDITIRPMDRDRYGRTVAMVYAGEKSVNEAMIGEGWSWVYTKYCEESFCAAWKNSEAAAKNARIGIWQESNIIPPWEWRHGGATGKQMAKAAVAADIGGMFIGNTNTRKFHSPDCRYAGCKHCTATFFSRTQAIAAGYVPCKVCRP